MSKEKDLIEAKKLAELFHEVYEREANKANWKTQISCRAKPFSELPLENQKTMIATAREVLKHYSSNSVFAVKALELEKEIKHLKEQAKEWEYLGSNYNCGYDNGLGIGLARWRVWCLNQIKKSGK